MTNRRPSCDVLASRVVVASIPPVDDNGGIFVCGIRPCEVSGVDFVVLVVRKPIVQVVAVHRQYTRVMISGNDLYGRLDRWQYAAESRQLSRVGSNEAQRFGETVSLVRAKEILAHVTGKLVTLDEGENRLDPLPGVQLAKGFETRRFDDVFQYGSDLNGHGGGAVAYDEATEEPRILRSGEQQRRRADVRADRMRPREPELLNDLSDELAHHRRREEVVPSLRMAKPRQVDRDEMGVLCEPGPHLLECEETFRPRTQENCRYVAWLTFGITDCQTVNLPDLGLD